ncbi:MAG TPA: heparan-alpha-glucosaminide N-acetyltransferase domain-containing protein [Candidatus Acidoferrum sp.]|nr:heparan-alpha-glucosaminide N-acetyltransferase domain-containing protein [Candidatus Acidoferrum sp.]
MPNDAKQRLAYIDWMRGFACLMMFQTHCYDSWLGGSARQTAFFKMSQLGGTLPAPLFLFLAGVSFAMTTDSQRSRGASSDEIARKTILRGAEIFGLALLFRLWEFLLGQGKVKSPWTDLLRVDILNIIGVSLMTMGVVCWIAARLWGSSSPAMLRWKNLALAAGVALAISLETPLLWTTWRPRWLPWFLESYVNGVHIYDAPQSWLFPFFPWAAFAFAGLAAGFFLMSDWGRAQQARAVALLAGVGAAIAGIAWCLDASRLRLYADYDFWHSSPNFFLIRVGVMTAILLISYLWCRWGPGLWGFSPLICLGQSSLMVYWIHIDLVYGAPSILPKQQQSIFNASLGLFAIFISMVFISIVRGRFKKRFAGKKSA